MGHKVLTNAIRRRKKSVTRSLCKVLHILRSFIIDLTERKFRSLVQLRRAGFKDKKCTPQKIFFSIYFIPAFPGLKEGEVG